MRRPIVSALAALALFAPPAAAQEKAVVRIATEGAFPPFNLVGDNNEPQGFEVDLGKALCRAMATECAIVLEDWEDLIPGLKAKRFDAVMASMAITPERRAKIAFSKPYYRIPAAFMAAKDVPIQGVTPPALAGQVVGAAERSEHAAYLQDLYMGVDVRLYGKLDEASLDLLSGRLDLVLGDKLALSKFLATREGACCRIVGDAPVDPVYHGEGIAVGVRKDDKELKERFNRAIDQVTADGTYDRIRQKYFDFDVRVK